MKGFASTNQATLSFKTRPTAASAARSSSWHAYGRFPPSTSSATGMPGRLCLARAHQPTGSLRTNCRILFWPQSAKGRCGQATRGTERAGRDGGNHREGARVGAVPERSLGGAGQARRSPRSERRRRPRHDHATQVADVLCLRWLTHCDNVPSLNKPLCHSYTWLQLAGPARL